jgi:uncharacterized protein with HEPN domain
MSPDSGTDAATLGDLATACSRVIDYTRGLSRADLDRNHQLLSACCYQIAVIGEAVKRLSAATRGKHSEVPWRDIAGMRDRLIHGYCFPKSARIFLTCSIRAGMSSVDVFHSSSMSTES